MRNYFSLVLIFAMTIFTASVAGIRHVDVSIDKPYYNSNYSISLDVRFSSEDMVSSVCVEHIEDNGLNAGSWYLRETSPGRWWEHSPQWLSYSSGQISGQFRILVTYSDGSTSSTDQVYVPDDVELGFVDDLQLINNNGYSISMGEVKNADKYYWRISDVITRKSVMSGYVNNPADFPTIPYDSLIEGKEYYFIGMARNSFSCGDYDLGNQSLFRSYDKVRFTAIPEPPMIIMFLLASFLGKISLSKHIKSK